MHLDKWTASITRAGLRIASSVATTPKGIAYNTHGKDTAARKSRSMDGREAGENENSCTYTGQTQSLGPNSKLDVVPVKGRGQSKGFRPR